MKTNLTYYVHARCRANPFSSMNSEIKENQALPVTSSSFYLQNEKKKGCERSLLILEIHNSSVATFAEGFQPNGSVTKIKTCGIFRITECNGDLQRQ